MAEEQYRKSPWANWNWGERPRHWVVAGLVLLIAWFAIATGYYWLGMQDEGNTWIQFVSGSWPNWGGIKEGTFEASLAITASVIINFVAPLVAAVGIVITVLRATRRNIMSDAGLIASYSSMLETELVEEISSKLYPESTTPDRAQKKKDIEGIVRSTLYSFNEYWFTEQLPILLGSPKSVDDWRKSVSLRGTKQTVHEQTVQPEAR